MIEWKDRVAIMVLSLIVVGGFIGVCVLMFFMHPIPQEMKELAMLLLGVLAGGFTTVINFWTGSNSSSQKKDATIASVATSTLPPKGP
jgi:hypothetical protein